MICTICGKEDCVPFEIMKKTTHGGKRKGSGRKKKEPTKVMRIPLSKVKAVKELISCQ